MFEIKGVPYNLEEWFLRNIRAHRRVLDDIAKAQVLSKEILVKISKYTNALIRGAKSDQYVVHDWRGG